MKNSNFGKLFIKCLKIYIILMLLMACCSCVTVNINYGTPTPKVEKADTLKINIESWY